MPRFRWTEEAKAEVVHRWRIGFTYAEIGAYFGVTDRAVALAVRRYGLIAPKDARVSASEKTRGRPKSHRHKQKLAEAQKATWTPERRALTAERVRQHRATEQGRAEMLLGIKTSARNKRGFDVPDDLRGEYAYLRRSKNIPAREAGAILGLIPSQATGGL